MASRNGKGNRGRKAGGEDRQTPVVVGLGASAASLDSLEAFFAHFTPRPDIAVVVVLQQREALDEAQLGEGLRRSGLGIVAVEDGTAVEGGLIYLAKPDSIVTVESGRFGARPATQPAGSRAVIDSFLVSLAEDCQDRAVAVVFNEADGDGTLGVLAVREQGGLTIADDDGREAVAGRAPAAFASAVVDFRLPPTRVPERIAVYADQLAQLRQAIESEAAGADVSAALARVAAILRNRTGHDFHGYKQNTFLRRVQRRMQVVQTDRLDAYVERLRTDPAEVEYLFNDLLIGVTRFFRDAKEFAVLEEGVVPKLFEGKGADDAVRVWVLGCATGEEAYSIAMLLREHMATLETTPRVQIFATDIDGRALTAARVGRYPETVANDLTPERLSRWFVREGNTYVVAKELREMCIFSAHSVIRDAPFSKLDLISCRNLLIYLDTELQDRAIPLFHFALRPGGYLFLGSSENVTRHPKLFAPVDRRSRIFRRLDTGTRSLPDFPIGAAADAKPPEIPPALRPRPRGATLARYAERIAERYAPAYVITDEQFEILHFSGRTGRYLDPPSGAASLNLLGLVHRDLRAELRAALHRAAETDTTVRADGLRLGLDGHSLVVDVAVEPMRPGPDAPRNFVVLFKDGPTVPETDVAPGPSVARDEHVRRLEQELRVTRERLQATIEELETTNEELQSSNEEYQSLNEELQSANEELQTSKEELQAVNEELTTVNGELAHRVQELGRTNSDLKNLLESTQIATVFLDNELRVTNYTPATAELFHLVETDVGRPISHIKSRIGYEELQEDARKVLRSLVSVEREVENPQTGGRYIARLLPYRSVDNFIAGVVLTFMDITPLTRAERALRESETRFRTLADAAPAIVWSNLPDGGIDYLNVAWTSYTGLGAAESGARGWAAVMHPEDLAGFVAALDAARASGEPLEREFRLRRADGAFRWHFARAAPMRDDAGRVRRWYGVAIDIHARREAEERQGLLLAELQHRVRNILAVVRSIARRTAETSETVEDYAAHLDGRLNAFARTQALVTRNPTAGVDLEMIVAEELNAHGARDGDHLRIDGPKLRLKARAAEIFGLAVHELATNAVKYGALANARGRIDVTWRVEDGGEPRLVFEWAESGVAVSGAPRRHGFGTELLERTLAYEFGAQTSLDFGPAGIRCRIELSLDHRIAVRPQGN